jgi:hypothetical protein
VPLNTKRREIKREPLILVRMREDEMDGGDLGEERGRHAIDLRRCCSPPSLTHTYCLVPCRCTLIHRKK